jgi:hypothetical protein
MTQMSQTFALSWALGQEPVRGCRVRKKLVGDIVAGVASDLDRRGIRSFNGGRGLWGSHRSHELRLVKCL